MGRTFLRSLSRKKAQKMQKFRSVANLVGIFLIFGGLMLSQPATAFDGDPQKALENYIPTRDGQPGDSDSQPKAFVSEKSDEEKIVGTVEVSTSLNIRSSPWGTIIGSFHNGDKLNIIGESGDWYKIEYQGRTAYVHRNYVSTAKKGASRESVSPPAQASGGSPGGGSPPSAGGPSQSRIVAAAQALVGVRNFPYAPATNGGRLGCAQVVSTALKNAGVLSRVTLGVYSVMDDLKKVGWKIVSAPPFQAGDVITWKTYDRTGDGVKDSDTHIGIIMGSGNSVQAMSNSSSARMPRLHSPFYQPISHVLRKV